MIAWLGTAYGWRTTFLATGGLGLIWLLPWIAIYRRGPLCLPDVTKPKSEGAVWRSVLTSRPAWLLMFARMLSDPVWYFYLFWFPKYLIDARARTLAQGGQTACLVYLAADVGSVAGGAFSGFFIRRGMQAVPARIR